jgi:hypothetical protein
MPFALFFIGIFLIVVGVRNQQGQFIALLGGDFSGPGNFFYWILALIAVGSIGFIPKAKPVSDGLLVLILIALLLGSAKTTATGGGLFTQLTNALKTTNQPSAAAITSGGSAITTATNAAAPRVGG